MFAWQWMEWNRATEMEHDENRATFSKQTNPKQSQE